MYFLIGKKLERNFSQAKLVTLSQFWVIHCMQECALNSANSQVEIAKEMFVSEATISKHIEKLQSQKFLKRSVDSKNRRRHILEITDKGKQIYEKSQKLLNAELEKIFSKIKNKDKKTILTNFRQILENLNKN